MNDKRTKRGKTIDFGGARDALPTVFEDGILTVQIEGAKLVNSRRKGTISLLLETHEIESSERIALQPVFVSSSTNEWEQLALQGQAKVADLLVAVTGEAPGELEPQHVIEMLTGNAVVIEIRLVRDGNGNEVNQLVRVVGAAPAPISSESGDDGDDDESRI